LMEILIPDIPVVEKLVRTAVIYGFLLVAFRLAGKRQLGQMSPFDLIVLLVISNAVQNALIGDDHSLGGGLIGAGALLVMNGVVAWASMRFRGFGRLVENTPTILVQHGQVLADSLRRECMTLPELRAALRREGVVSVGDVRYAILEEDGHVSVIRRRPA
jgi:uncharacterized membrane protein YcaP (DUF421 family)